MKSKKKLNEYLKENGCLKNWFAKKIGTTSPIIWSICNGPRSIPKKYWLPIVDATKGFVTIDDLIEDYLLDMMRRVGPSTVTTMQEGKSWIVTLKKIVQPK